MASTEDAVTRLANIVAGGDPAFAGATATAPAAAAVIADTGALPAGTYRVEIVLGFSGTVAAGKHLLAELRSSDNTSTVSPEGLCPAGAAVAIVRQRLILAANQRIRVINGIIAAAGEVAFASIRAYLLPA